jgi:hypothetical protein
MADELLLEDETDRLIQRFGKPAVIAEFERRERHHAKRGANPQKDGAYLFEMAQIIYSQQGALAESLLGFQGKRPQIGRVAGIIADRQNPKSRKTRDALIKRWKRKFRRSYENPLAIAIVEIIDTLDIRSILSSPQFDGIRALDECLRRLEDFKRLRLSTLSQLDPHQPDTIP